MVDVSHWHCSHCCVCVGGLEEEMKTVIEMAREAGIIGNFWPELERFAELVRAEECDACAKVVEINCHDDMTRAEEAAAIRARSNT